MRISRLLILSFLIFVSSSHTTSLAYGLLAPVEPMHHYGRTRHFDLLHQKIDLDIDLQKRFIQGHTTLKLIALREALDWITLDAQELKILSVKILQRDTEFTHSSGKLRIKVPSEDPTKKQEIEIQIQYEGSPQKGIFFRGPSSAYPNDPYQAWTQGQSEDSQFWFPTYDYPNDKATTEVILRIRKEFQGFSNGDLIENSVLNEKRIVHFRMNKPHSTYLVAFVVGKFDVVEEKLGSVLLQYVVPVGKKKDVPMIFGRTQAMLKAMEELAGEKYPYSKYSQLVVHDFLYGGMENTTVTTLNDYVLYPSGEKEAFFRNVDSLLAHELAHQWFGNLITTDSWNHIWLNEGFATYFDALTTEKIRGREEFEIQMLENAQSVIGSSNQRATATKTYENPDDVFDSNVYDRGAWILHMLRNKVGDRWFFEAIKNYVKRHKERNVDTAHLRQIFEETTGYDLGPFFDQWVYRSGFLTLNTSWKFKEEEKIATLEVKQKHVLGSKGLFYDLDLDVDFVFKDRVERRTLSFASEKGQISLETSEAPMTVRVDPEMKYLRSIKTKRSPEELIIDTTAPAPRLVRLQAVEELSNDFSSAARMQLRKIIQDDPSWRVRANAAESLGKSGTQEDFVWISSHLHDASPQVRAAKVRALGKFKPRPEAIFKRQFEKESSTIVRAQIARLVGTHLPEYSSSFQNLILTTDSYLDFIRTEFFHGLAETPQSIPWNLVKRWSAPGVSKRTRRAALRALGSLAAWDEKMNAQAVRLLLENVRDPFLRVSMAAVSALGEAGNSMALADLEVQKTASVYGSMRKAAERAIEKIHEKNRQSKSLDRLGRELEEMKKRLEKLENHR